MLTAESRVQLLKDMGITLWTLRESFLFLNKPLFSAKLAVLLAKPLKAQDREAHKILTGMLSVLELEKDEYWIGWMPEIKDNPFKDNRVKENIKDNHFMQDNFKTESRAVLDRVNSLDSFWRSMKTWMPNAILLLGEYWLQVINKYDDSEIPVYHSFHPEELIERPEKKKEAYQSLLNLKKNLVSV